LSSHFSLLVSHYGHAAVFILMVLESACIPIPSEAVVPYAGYLASIGAMSFWTIVIEATIANVIGGSIAYAVGVKGGRPLILKYGQFILLNQHHLEKAERWFAKRGEVTVAIGRLLPVIRTFISLPAGIARMPFGKFLLYSAIGSLPWNFALAYAGYQLGRHFDTISHYYKPLTYFGASVFVVGVVWFWFSKGTARRR